MFHSPFRLALCVLALLLGLTPASRANTPSVLINLDYEELLSIRRAIQADDAEVTSAYAELIGVANGLLSVTPASVMDKTNTAPSGDKHDFYAIGNYSWPNPDTVDGLPYIRRDGYKNPEAVGPAYDKGAYNTLVRQVNTLALAWFYSGDETYAAKAAVLLRTWFLDPATRMNPHLQYASAQPGVHEGHYGGIIEGVVLVEMLDYVRLLTLSTSWTPADDNGLKAWFTDFTTWLLESDFGQQEAIATNNHGVWYAAQVAVFSKYAGQDSHVLQMMALGRDQIASQIAADGSLPRELTRSNSFMYSVYCLRAFTALARCGEGVGEDLWHYTAPNGSNLALAFAFIAPYLSEDLEWIWPRIDTGIDSFAIQISRLAAKQYRTAALVKAAAHLYTLRSVSDRMARLLGRTPTSIMGAFDDFNDYPANVALNGLVSGTGWADAWTAVNGITISDTSITYVLGDRTLGGGRSLKVPVSSGNAFGRNLLPAPDSSGRDYFVSFLARIEGGTGPLPTSGIIPFAGWQACDGTPSDTNDTIGIIGKSGKAGARVAGADALASTVLEYGRTYFFVIGYGGWNGSTYQSATLWVNPGINDDASTDASVKAVKTTTASGQGSDGFIGLRVRTVALNQSGYYLFDDVRVGRSWREVVPAPAIAFDCFDTYWPGTPINGLNNGFGWAGPWAGVSGVTVSMEEILYPFDVTLTLGGGNTLKVAATSEAVFSRNVLPIVDQSGRDYFVSFIFRIKGGSGALTSGANPFLAWQARDATPAAANDTIGLTGKGGKVGARVSTTDTLVPRVLNYDETYFFVVQYGGWSDGHYQTATVWLNPSADDQFTSNPEIKASRTMADVGQGSDGFLGLIARSVALGSGTYYLIDEVCVGRSWGDVVPLP